MLFYSVLGIIDVMFKVVHCISCAFYFHSDKLIFYSVLMAAESFVLRYICQQYCKKDITVNVGISISVNITIKDSQGADLVCGVESE